MQPFNSSSISDADLLLNLHSRYQTSPQVSTSHTELTNPSQQPFSDQQSAFIGQRQQQYQDFHEDDALAMPYGNMMIENQDIDMSAVMRDDMMWLEYLPHDLMGVFDPGGGGSDFGR